MDPVDTASARARVGALSITMTRAASDMLSSGSRWNQIRRSHTLRVLASLAVVWIAASVLKPVTVPARTEAFSPILGHGLPTDAKYGLNPKKLAIIFEPHHVPQLAFVLLHTINVLPFDWPVLYVGTHKSISHLNDSYSIKVAQEKGRLTLQEAPTWINYNDTEHLQRMFANPSFYDSLPPAVEHLFIAGTDSIMCSASLTTMDDWLQYDWAGSPWVGNSWHDGYNGYSLRRVSKVKQALRIANLHPDQADDSTAMEAVWSRPGAVVPDMDKSAVFVMESGWVERPMAYHPSVKMVKEDEGWLKNNGRKGIWDHCPEVKVVMHMKLNRQKCPDLSPADQAKENQRQEDAKIAKEMADRDRLEQEDMDAEEGFEKGTLHGTEDSHDSGKAMLHGD